MGPFDNSGPSDAQGSILGESRPAIVAPAKARRAALRAIDPDNAGLLELLSGGRRRLRPAEYGDVGPLAEAMRPADVAELEGWDGATPAQALCKGLMLSTAPLTLDVDGAPAAMFGAAPQAADGGSFGVVWMLGTEQATSDQRWFLVASRAALADLAAPFRAVGCVVDCRYEASLRWLLALGFFGAEGGETRGHTGLAYRWMLWHHP